MAKNMRRARETMDQLYLDREESGDVTFIVESERIRAHRSVLAATSAKYKAQFFGLRPDLGDIRVSDVSAAAFKEFLQFFYKKTIDLTTDNIETVLDLAKQSLVEEFVNCCIRFIKDKLLPNNLFAAYRLAISYDLKSIIAICEKRIVETTSAVLASDSFLKCDQDLLLHVLESITKFECTEVDVFNACINWARENCKRNGLDETNPKNLRSALGDAIYQVRFSSMSPDQFTNIHKSLDGFFTPDESIELFYITAKLKNFKSQIFNQAPRYQYCRPTCFPVESRRSTEVLREPRHFIRVYNIGDDEEW